jgi:hypothetical protein
MGTSTNVEGKSGALMTSNNDEKVTQKRRFSFAFSIAIDLLIFIH